MSRKAFEAQKQFGDYSKYDAKDTTPETLVKDLIALLDLKSEESVLDAGSGKNKVWFKNIPTNHTDEVEIDEGKDYYKYEKKTDWVIGNPPFKELIGFIFKSTEICNKGFAFLTNHTRLNQLTPKRLEDLKNKGFYLNKICIIEIKKWFGRYYFLIFTKEPSPSIIHKHKKYE